VLIAVVVAIRRNKKAQTPTTMTDDATAVAQAITTGAVDPTATTTTTSTTATTEEEEEGATTTAASSSAPSSAFDLDHIQSLICGAFDPFITLKEDPPPPAGFIRQEGDTFLCTNGASKPDEPLLQYTSAGPSVATLYQSFEYGVQRNPQAPCLGKRPTSTSASYEWATYEKVQADAAKLGSYLKDLGVTPGQRVGLSGKNAPDYLTAIQACFWAGATTVCM
jgi:hypothetical protein